MLSRTKQISHGRNNSTLNSLSLNFFSHIFNSAPVVENEVIGLPRQHSRYKVQLTIRDSSVYRCLAIRMKLQSISVILALCVSGLVGMADGLCLVRNTTDSNLYWYQCVRSNDYLADIERSPIDVHGYTVSNSKIKVIKNRSYARLGKNLQSFAVIYCGVEEIEDNAFQGLSKIKTISLIGNKLEIIKSAWFDGLSNLKKISFEKNQIKLVEDNFFSILPPLDILDISNNQLTCISVASFGNFKTNAFHFLHNPLTWTCRVSIFEWLEKTGVSKDYPYSNNMDPPDELLKICKTKLPGFQLDEESIKKCVEETARRLLPVKKDFSVRQVCEYLRGKNSPFLDCTT